MSQRPSVVDADNPDVRMAAWEYGGEDIQNDTVLNKEPLEFENVESVQKRDDGSFLVKTAGAERETRTVIVATGAAPRHLGIEGEEKLIANIKFTVKLDDKEVSSEKFRKLYEK